METCLSGCKDMQVVCKFSSILYGVQQRGAVTWVNSATDGERRYDTRHLYPYRAHRVSRLERGQTASQAVGIPNRGQKRKDLYVQSEICIAFDWPRGCGGRYSSTPDEGDQDGDGEERQQTQARPPEGLGSDVMEMDGDELVIRGSLLCCRRPCERPLLCGSSPGILTDLTTSPPSPPTSSAS